MINEYNKDYRTRKYDKYSDLEPQRERKKPSFLTLLLFGLLVFLVCSLGYDNIVKPYLDKRELQTEKPVVTSIPEVEDMPSSEVNETTSADNDAFVPVVREKLVQKSQPIFTEQPSVTTAPVSGHTDVESMAKITERASTVSSEPRHENTTSKSSASEDISGLPTSEILERRMRENIVQQAKQAGVSTEGTTSEILDRITHASIVQQAKQAGVNTEGTTSEILDRITHANIVRQAKQAGVSTEGTTSEILDRITHANIVRQAKQAGVSTEGTTSEILDRITHASIVQQAKQAGVSTEGTTSEILDRITRKNLERLNR